MKRWIYYNRLAALDFVRLWASTQQHVIIVAGICLPLLMLLGLKRGHVAELRKDLLTSPSGRQVVFWSARQGALLDGSSIEKLRCDIPAVDLIIPETQRVVRLAGPVANDGAASPELAITLYSTRPRDPILAQLNADVLKNGERAVILPDSVAKQLGVSANDTVTLTVDRERGGVRDEASIHLVVKKLIPSGPEKNNIGYGDATLLDLLEQFIRGYRVEELDWPALRVPVRDRYASYLLYCEPASDLSLDDRAAIADRGLQIADVTDFGTKSLYGAIKAESLRELRVYEVSSESSLANPRHRLILSPSELAELTSADDVVIPWNKPAILQDKSGGYRLVGLSLPTRCWLKDHLLDPKMAFSYETETNKAVPLNLTGIPSRRERSVRLLIEGTNELSLGLPAIESGEIENPIEPAEPSDTDVQEQRTANLAVVGQTTTNPAIDPDKATKNEPAVLFVPVNLLANFDAFRHGLAQFDPETQLFVPVAEAPSYDKARLYASTIDDVPAIVDALMARRFAVMSESTRIAEIHEQDQSLHLLVFVVGLGVFFFGVLTVINVLSDSTDRKRGTIGILRVMGVSRIGIFYLVVLRAAAIGILAGVVSLLFGEALSWLLMWHVPAGSWLAQWKPNVTILISPTDLAWVFAGAITCAALGALWPALRASRLDPFDAIVEGRFR